MSGVHGGRLVLAPANMGHDHQTVTEEATETCQ
jgi:hypothetical protein